MPQFRAIVVLTDETGDVELSRRAVAVEAPDFDTAYWQVDDTLHCEYIDSCQQVTDYDIWRATV